MREIRIGENMVRVRATALALLFYRQEFKRDLVGDLVKMAQAEDDLSQFDTLTMLQVVWAMAKADVIGKGFPSFETWLAELGEFDLADPEFGIAAMEEAVSGFFPGKGSARK